MSASPAVQQLVLYSYWRSSCSWRVRSVLALKAIPYEYRAVSLYTGEQHSEAFKAVNPAGMVPTLLVPTKDGKHETLFESLAIIDYLEQTHPQPSIYPTDPIQRAKVIAVVESIVSGIQPLQNLGPMNKAAEFAGGSKAKAVEWNQYWISTRFATLEGILQGLSGRYTVGDQLTLADICLVPQVYNALRYNVQLDSYPLIKRLYEQLLATEECIIKAKPENQVDSDDFKERKLAGY